MSIFSSILGSSNNKRLSPKSITHLVKEKSSAGYGGFLDLNNDLGHMVDELQSHADEVLMPYLYARRTAAAGMFSQGIIDKQDFDQVDSLFFNFMAKVGSNITRDEQIAFQNASADNALELEVKYTGVTSKTSSLLVMAAKNGVSVRDALLKALESQQGDLEHIVEPVMCKDWVMKPEYCIGFFATGSWEPRDNFENTSKKVLKYFKAIGISFGLEDTHNGQLLDPGFQSAHELFKNNAPNGEDDFEEKQDEIINKLTELSNRQSTKTVNLEITPIYEIWSWEFKLSDDELEAAWELVSMLNELRDDDITAMALKI